MSSQKYVLLSLLTVALSAGCQQRAPGLTVHGQVSLATSIPLVGALVSLHCDVNSDGRIDESERVETLTDATGSYSVHRFVSSQNTTILSISHPSAVKKIQTFVVNSNADIKFDSALAPAHSLRCQHGTCTSDDGRLEVRGLPQHLESRGRVFDPGLEADFFPGAFGDSKGNLLLSGVFSSIELFDRESKQTVTSLTQSAELRMQYPHSTQRIVTDIHPNSGKIEYPLYAFDETSGQWVREGEGLLESAPGKPIAEESLASIKNGSYTGDIFAVAQVNHFSFWNVDWPISSFGCITGTVENSDGQPMAGATVNAIGVTYIGRSMTRTTSGDGRFCIEAMRSESAVEDIDLDGVQAEVQRVNVAVERQAMSVTVSIEMPTLQAECGGQCLDLGRIRLLPNTPHLKQSNDAQFIPAFYSSAAVNCSPEGASISWPLQKKAVRIRVMSANGLPRWIVEATPGLESPLRFGMLNSQMTPIFPKEGQPTPLAKGDLFRIDYLDGTRDIFPIE